MKGCVIAVIFIMILFGGCAEELSPPGSFVNKKQDNAISDGPITIPGSGGQTSDVLKINQSFNSIACTCEAAVLDISACTCGKRTAGLRISALTQVDVNPEELTTQRTLGLWPNDNKYHIEGIGAQFNGGFQNAGFVDVLLLYYDQPFEEEFKISARIRIRRAGGVSTSKGIHIGAYSNMSRAPMKDNDNNYVPAWGANQLSKGLGLFFRAESNPQFRIYYSDQYASTTAGTGVALSELFNLALGKEYIYEVARTRIYPSRPYDDIVTIAAADSALGITSADIGYSGRNARYTFQLLDSKTYEPVVKRGTPPAPVAIPHLNIDALLHPVGNTAIEMHPTLKGSVYAGVCISASVAEVSQIKIWTSAAHGGNGMNWDYKATANADGTFTGSGDMPIFATPDTIPAYVPADNLTVAIAPTKTPADVDGERVYTWSSVTNGANWGNPGPPAVGLVGSNYTITFTPTALPAHAHTEIHYQLFPIGSVHKAFLTNPLNPIDPQEQISVIELLSRMRITGSGSRQRLFLKDDGTYIVVKNNDNDPSWNLVNETHKVLSIGFDPNQINPGETVSLRLKIVARDLDVDKDNISDVDYALLQTLAEYNFRIQITKPAA